MGVVSCGGVFVRTSGDAELADRGKASRPAPSSTRLWRTRDLMRPPVSVERAQRAQSNEPVRRLLARIVLPAAAAGVEAEHIDARDSGVL